MERTIFSKILELTSYLLILFVILKGYLHSASHPICIEIQISFDWLTSELGSPFVENYLLTIAFKDPNNRSRFDWTVNNKKIASCLRTFLLIHISLMALTLLLRFWDVSMFSVTGPDRWTVTRATSHSIRHEDKEEARSQEASKKCKQCYQPLFDFQLQVSGAGKIYFWLCPTMLNFGNL